MSGPAYVYQGAKTPEAYAVDVTPGTSGIDLSTVTAATFSVETPGGAVVTWTATRTNQTATTLTLTYVFAGAGTDVAVVGPYNVVVTLTVPAGTVRCAPRLLTVRGSYEVSP